MYNSNKKSNKGGNSKARGKKGFKPRREQPRKDSDDKRVNYDNTRESKFEKDIEEGSKSSSANDISDFNRNPELLRAAGSIPFNPILGDETIYTSNAVPGIMAMYWVPSIGGDAIPYAANQASNAMYSFVAHANSRHYVTNAPDMFLMNLAGAQVFSLLATGMRAYGFIKYYNEHNLYYPDTIIQAMGFDAQDWRHNLANIWFGINDMIARLQQIWIPNTIPILKRWFDKNSHVYLDAPGPQTQTYLYVQSKYYMLNETGYMNGTTCSLLKFDPERSRMVTDPTRSPAWVAYNKRQSEVPGNTAGYGNQVDWNVGSQETFFLGPDTAITWKEYVSAVNYAIEALLQSEDRGIIYGNMLKAYGQDKLYSIAPMDVNFMLAPEYNAEVLMQFENVNILPNVWPAAFTQIDNQVCTAWLSYYPSYDYRNQPSAPGSVNALRLSPPVNHILNMHFDGQPTPESVMIATRSMNCAIHKDYYVQSVKLASDPGPVYKMSTVKGFVPKSTSSEIVSNVAVFVGTVEQNGTDNFYFLPQYEVINQEPELETQKTGAMGALMAFDWHPFMYRYTANTGDPTDAQIENLPALNVAYGDYDNFAYISDYELAKLNDTALYSVWGLPMSLA